MLPISYTTSDAIRSLLGLDEDDLSDEQITARNLEKELNMDIASWCSNHVTLADLVNTGLATQVEVDLVDALGLYSAYFCAKLVIPAMQLGASQKIADGKNSYDRFTTVDFQKIYEQMSERAAFYKTFIVNNNVALVVTTLASTYKPFSLVAPSYDPVTGA